MVERECNSLGDKRLKYIECRQGAVHLRPLGMMPTSDMVRANRKGESSYKSAEINHSTGAGTPNAESQGGFKAWLFEHQLDPGANKLLSQLNRSSDKLSVNA